MTIKFIQVNIYKGKYLDELVDFLKKEKPDFVSMQEVTAGEVNLWKDKSVNLFERVKMELAMQGLFHNDILFSEFPNALFGNAVLSRFLIRSHNAIVLKRFRAVTYNEAEGSKAFDIRPLIPRSLLDIEFNVDGQKIHAMSWHGAWTAPPTDTEETLRQARMVADHLKSLNVPFILGGDLNALPQSKTVGLINEVVNNLMMNSGIVQTTHPTLHKIVPRGYLIDYVFCSNHFKLISVEVPGVTISDHLPVVVNLEF